MAMSYDPNDPRLTSYALDELDESERPSIEAQLAECAESRKTVEEVRATALLLSAELRQESSPGLTTEQRQALEGRLTEAARPARRILRYAMAAGVFLALG